MRGIRPGIIALTFVTAACSVSVPPPQARVRRGVAFADRLTKILALPTVCRYEMCNEGHRLAVNNKARMALEFAGYRVFDSERVNVYLRERVIRTDERSSGSARRDVVVEGGTWADATIDERRALLKTMGVDGIFEAIIDVGAAKNLEDQRTVTVRVDMIRADGRELAWRSLCAVETGRYHDFDKAVELATRCALQSAAQVGAL